jgi:endo-1,4-beta-xylanase
MSLALTRSSTFAVLAVCASCAAAPPTGRSSARPSAPATAPASPPPVENTLKQAAGARRIGAAVQVDPLANDPAYRNVLAKEFSAVTPENAMKWGAVEGQRGELHWSDADAIVAFATEHGMRIKGHCLLWHRHLPPYVSSLHGADLQAVIDEHIRQEVSHYKGKVFAWDVVNEAIDQLGNDYRDTVFYRELGPGFIARAFEVAHEADPDAALYYNEYGAEAPGQKADRVLALVEGLLRAHVPITGVGFQFHVSASDHPPADRIGANLKRFTDLGLSINISEMDVSTKGVQGPAFEVQRAAFHDLVRACVLLPRCDGITFWGLTDKHSWLDSVLTPDAPLLFDADYQEKPAYRGVLDALLER